MQYILKVVLEPVQSHLNIDCRICTIMYQSNYYYKNCRCRSINVKKKKVYRNKEKASYHHIFPVTYVVGVVRIHCFCSGERVDGMEEWVRGATALSVVLIVVGVLWALLWKLVLEPNPLVRDFFDLDRPSSSTLGRKSAAKTK